jgi:spermidine/putrescine transport system substrate-binding protein
VATRPVPGPRAFDRRRFLRLSAIAGGAGILAACRQSVDGAGSAPLTPSDRRPPIEEETGDLAMFGWAGSDTKQLWKGYAQEGYPDPTWAFYTTDQQAIARTAGGFEWDVCWAAGQQTREWVELGAVQPWDTSLLENWPDLMPQLQTAGQVDGQQYNVIIDWVALGVLADPNEVDVSAESYELLFDDAYADKIGWWDSPRMLTVGAMAIGIEGDIFNMGEEQLDEVKAFLIDRKKNVHVVWADPTSMWDDMAQGNLHLTLAWPDAWVVLREDKPLEYVKPPGMIVGPEGLVLRAETENYFHAHEFMDAYASAETATFMMTDWAIGVSNQNADLSAVDDETLAVFGLDDPETALSEPTITVEQPIGDTAAYARAWDEVMAS